jgi:C-terminal processing protease CtpA/Prc
MIASIEPNSAAAAAGLKPDDELLVIDIVPADRMTLAQISRLFHSQNGRAIPLVVRRADGELYSTSLHLKRRI